MTTDDKYLPIAESYWVISGRFRAGEYPGSVIDGDARQKLRWLLNQDTNVFVDLTEEGESGLKPYNHLLAEERAGHAAAVVYKRLPLTDFNTPTHEILEEVLDTIDLALSLGRNVYLHCYGGKGRTGTVVGCYLVRHGLAGQEALERIQALRNDIPGRGRQSPETEGQKRMVLEWKQGQ